MQYREVPQTPIIWNQIVKQDRIIIPQRVLTNRNIFYTKLSEPKKQYIYCLTLDSFENLGVRVALFSLSFIQD